MRSNKLKYKKEIMDVVKRLEEINRYTKDTLQDILYIIDDDTYIFHWQNEETKEVYDMYGKMKESIFYYGYKDDYLNGNWYREQEETNDKWTKEVTEIVREGNKKSRDV